MPSCMLGRGWLKPAQEGTGFWDKTPRQSPTGLLGGKGQGPKAMTGTQEEEPPTSPPHYSPWTTPQLRPCTQIPTTAPVRGIELQ